MASYFRGLSDTSSIKQILDLLSASVEYKKLVEQRSSDKEKLSSVVNAIKENLRRRDETYGNDKPEKHEKNRKVIFIYYFNIIIYLLSPLS